MILGSMRELGIRKPFELPKLAAWYREFAERAGGPAIWEARLKTVREWSKKPTNCKKAQRETRTDNAPTPANKAWGAGSAQAVP